jgi:hypothetical protein
MLCMGRCVKNLSNLELRDLRDLRVYLQKESNVYPCCNDGARVRVATFHAWLQAFDKLTNNQFKS